MPTLQDIQKYTRDFQRYTGDGLPNAPVGHPLPVGDPASGVYHPSKAEIRQMLLSVLQAIGDPDALDDLLAQIAGAADLQNSTSSFTDRANAVARGQEKLPVNIGMILTREGNYVAIRGALVSADDPLFNTSPYWGVIVRLPTANLLDLKADLANSGKTFPSRASAVSAGQAALPSALGQIETREGEYQVIRSPSASADDPLFETSPRWGVVLRVPSVDLVGRNLSAAVRQFEARENYDTPAAFAASTSNGAVGYSGFKQYRNDNGTAVEMPLDAIANASQWTVSAGIRGLVIDENTKKLLIPEFQIKRGRMGAFETVKPATGLYFEVEAGDLPGEAEIARLAYYDLGSGSGVGPQVVDMVPQYGNIIRDKRVILAVTRGGAISSQMGLAQVVRNVVQRGAFARQLVMNQSYLRSITNSTLNPLGINEVASCAQGNPQAAVRIPDTQIASTNHIFVRAFVVLGAGEAANSFPATVQAHTISRTAASANGSGMTLLGGAMLLEKVYGDRVASYIASVTRLTEGRNTGAIRVGVYGEASSRDISISLPQVGFASQPALFVQPNDWPLAASDTKLEPSIYYPEVLSKFDNRPLPIYALGLTGGRVLSYERMPMISVMSENTGNGNNGSAPAPFTGVTRDSLRIGRGDLANGFEVRLSLAEDAPFASRRAFMYTTAKVASGVSGRSFALACIGDSITDVYPTAVRTGGVLLNEGAAAVTYVGTMSTANQPREGRAGRTLAQYINKNTLLLPVTDAAAYNALTDAEKRTYNPFIRPASGGEAGAYNGHVFDYANYLSRFGLATPTHAVINLGTNDMFEFEDPEALKLHMVDGLTIMANSILAADPNVKVIFAMGTDQWEQGNHRQRAKRYDGVIRGILAATRAIGSSRVSVAPAWAHMNGMDFNDNLVTATYTDPDTGAIIREVGADVHFSDTALREFCECVAATVANA